MKRRRRTSAKLILLAVVLLILGAGMATMQLFQNAMVLGGWFWPLVLLMMALLAVILAWILRKQELAWLRVQLGDRLFYEKFPGERLREEKRLGHPLALDDPTPEEVTARHAGLVDRYVQEAKEKYSK